MDVEDWFHLDYFDKNNCDQNFSTLDGFDIYLKILDDYGVKSTFFIVGELVSKLHSKLKNVCDKGHELGIHSYSHKRPLQLELHEFKIDTLMSMESLSNITGNFKFGYRAPCFSLDRGRLNILKELGLSYDASKIDFTNHPLYGDINLNGFNLIQPCIYRMGQFIEFEMSTLKILGLRLPISGGGYLRIIPWFIMKFILKAFLKHNQFYFFYIHPFELSRMKYIPFPSETSLLTKLRFSFGRNTVEKKVKNIIELLKHEGYEIVTFSDLKSMTTGLK
jgi:peptidoglycan/xylan/chitin deacetylase (PgdA/CDA1 family)